MTRTFIALEFDGSLQDYLAGVIKDLAYELPAIRWVKPESIHLTLAFLGELSDEQLAEAMLATEEAAKQSLAFGYRLTRLGIFGSLRQPRVVWMGIEELSGKLLALHRILNLELHQRGFELDARPFSPHVTLSRIKEPLRLDELQRLQHILGDTQFLAPSPIYRVSQLEVVKSELARSGAIYTPLRSYRLG